ncbi:MAG: hypothetical protein JRJ57_00925 [Deltaproteobacteria bacterium]|nr:hypothetical protein [Deltaproteobacteria bacterium]
MESINLNDIPLSFIRRFIPRPVFLKLEAMDIQSLQDLIEIDTDQLSIKKFIRANFVMQVRSLIEWVKENSPSLIDTYLENCKPILAKGLAPDLYDIKIKDISKLIPSKLVNKFEANNISSLSDLTRITSSDFEKLPSVGSKMLDYLKDFIDDLSENPELYIKHGQLNSNGILIDAKPDRFTDPIRLLKDIVDSFLEIIAESDNRQSEILIHACGLKGRSKKNYNDLGVFYNLTGERIRQLVEIFNTDIENLLLTGEFKSLRCYIDSESHNLLTSLEEKIYKRVAISLTELKEILTTISEYPLSPTLEPYLSLYCTASGFRVAGKVESSFTDQSILVNESKIDKPFFMNVSRTLFKILIKQVLPISEFDIIVQLKREKYNVTPGLISDISSTYPEIIHSSINGEAHYKIRFDKLASLSDMAVRILYETRVSMTVEQIANEINRRLYRYGSDRYITKHSLKSQVNRDKRVSSKGRLGLYFFQSPGENVDSIRSLIIKSLLHFNKDASAKTIHNHIKKQRPEIQYKSLYTIATIYFIRLKNGNFILEDWKGRYCDSDIKPDTSDGKQSSYEKCRDVFRKAESDVLSYEYVFSELTGKYGVHPGTTYNTLRNQKFLKTRIDEDGNRLLVLINEESKKTKIKVKDKIEIAVNKYFSNRSHPVRLNIFVKAVANDVGITNASVYKFIHVNSHLFNRFKLKGKDFIAIKSVKDHILLKSSLETDRIWETLKNEITNDIEPIFTSDVQPKYSISIYNAIDLLRKMAESKTDYIDLDSLDDQILPTLQKIYFGRNDKNDLLNLHKQLATSLDPFIKKLIYFTDPDQYPKNITNVKGLGTGFNILSRLDPHGNRYKNQEEAAEVRFGKQIQSAYSARNISTHQAKLWTKHQIVKSLTDIICVYVYAILEYNDELNRNL